MEDPPEDGRDTNKGKGVNTEEFVANQDNSDGGIGVLSDTLMGVIRKDVRVPPEDCKDTSKVLRVIGPKNVGSRCP